MSDEFAEVPEIAAEVIGSIAERIPAIPGIDAIMSAVIMAIMPMVTGGTTCQCDVCQTLSGVLAGLQA